MEGPLHCMDLVRQRQEHARAGVARLDVPNESLRALPYHLGQGRRGRGRGQLPLYHSRSKRAWRGWSRPVAYWMRKAVPRALHFQTALILISAPYERPPMWSLFFCLPEGRRSFITMQQRDKRSTQIVHTTLTARPATTRTRLVYLFHRPSGAGNSRQAGNHRRGNSKDGGEAPEQAKKKQQQVLWTLDTSECFSWFRLQSTRAKRKSLKK